MSDPFTSAPLAPSTEARFDRVLLDVDGPLLVLLRDPRGVTWLGSNIERSDAHDDYLCAPVSAARLSAFRHGAVDLRDLLAAPVELCAAVVRIPATATSEQALHLTPVRFIPNDWLPDVGFFLTTFLAPDAEVWHGFPATAGDHASAGDLGPTSEPARPSDEQLRHWSALAKAATPGPWYSDDADAAPGDVSLWRGGQAAWEGEIVANLGDSVVQVGTACENEVANARFIAAAREAVPALIYDLQGARFLVRCLEEGVVATDRVLGEAVAIATALMAMVDTRDGTWGEEEERARHALRARVARIAEWGTNA